MTINTLIATITCQNSIGKTSRNISARHKYIIEKYHERSITNRYFK